MSRKNNKKAYFFTLDALFALVILLAVIILIPFTHISSVPEKYRTSFLQEDMLRLLSTLKTKEINNSAIDGNISALNLSVKEMLDDNDKFLDTLTKIWASSENYAENMEILKNVTEAFFGEVFDARDNIGLFFEKDGTLEEIFLRNTTSHTTARDITTAKKFVTGVQYGKPLGGYSARAFTYKTERVKYVYFGGYVGDGNITQKFELPLGANVTNLTIEIAIFGSSFNIKINGNVTSNSPIMPASDAFTPIKVSNFIQEELSWLHEGENEISFESTTNNSLYIAGGFIRITYKTTQGYASKPKRYLPFIKGTMNLYDSLFAPGNITSLAIHLEYEQQANTTPFVRIANVTVWRDERENRTGYNSVTITNETIFNALKQAGLGYENISRVTVPIRIGLEEIAQNISGGNADVVVITDVSGSMRWKLNESSNGIQRSCNDPDLTDNSTQRLSLAKCLDKDFIEIILNASGNRVGLISFRNAVENTHQLSVNKETLYEQIEAYSADGETCICCAINEAYTLFDKPEVIIPKGRNEIRWKTEARQNCGDACGFNETMPSSCNISDWYSLNYNENNMINRTLPYSNSSENGVVRYFRKKFYLPSNVLTDGVLYVNYQRGVECYLNGNLIGRDNNCRVASGSTNPLNWPNWSVSRNYFRVGENVLACRIRSGTSSGKTGLYFDAQLEATTASGNRTRFVLVMSDGIAGRSCVNSVGVPNATCYYYDQPRTYNPRIYNGTSTTGSTCCSGGGSSDCWNFSKCEAAMKNAIWSANRTYQEKIKQTKGKIYAVGFVLGNCSTGIWTLNETAKVGNGSFYPGNNATELQNIYREIASEILRLSYANQTIVVVGNASSNLTNGYIEMDFERDEYYEQFGNLGYLGGEQSDQLQGSIFGDFITYETQGFSDGMVNFSFQHGIPYEAVIVSYSGPVWTKFASINNTTAEYEIYNLTRWSNVYTFLGDPFRVNIPPEYIARNGTTNTVSLLLGANASSSQNPTSSSKIIYTLVIPPLFSYSTPQPKKEGCNWTIEYEEPAGSGFSGGNFSVLVPPTYSGEKKCFYTNSTIRYYDDAYDVAVFNLLSNSLDVNPHNGMVEIKLGAEVSINAIILSGVPFMQYTSIKAMSWR
ncbi:MAG: VWA domain-containing protein [Candidatus Pacearchaeota archaeon]